MTWDAIVAGAGPAGAVAARVMAQGGMTVLLLDRPPARRLKVGEALPGAALRLMRALDLPLPSVARGHRPLGGTLSAWGSERLAATDFISEPDGPGWRLDRRRFECDLRACARASGVMQVPVHVRNVRREVDGWHLTADNGQTFAAAWLVEATGRAAAIARRIGVDRRRDERMIAVYAVGRRDPGPALSRTVVEARPDGWWYAAKLPNDGAIAVFHASRPTAARLVARPDAWLKALASTRHISTALDGVTFGHPSGCDAGTTCLRSVHGDGWIACGDAALSFDPISSQGIFSAMYGGMAAGQAVLEAARGGAAPFEAYAARHAAIDAAYRQRLRETYAQERRWLDEPFWACRVTRQQSAS